MEINEKIKEIKKNINYDVFFNFKLIEKYNLNYTSNKKLFIFSKTIFIFNFLGLKEPLLLIFINISLKLF